MLKNKNLIFCKMRAWWFLHKKLNLDGYVIFVCFPVPLLYFCFQGISLFFIHLPILSFYRSRICTFDCYFLALKFFEYKFQENRVKITILSLPYSFKKVNKIRDIIVNLSWNRQKYNIRYTRCKFDLKMTK